MSTDFNIQFEFPSLRILIFANFYLCELLPRRTIGLATKWLRILSISPNDKIRNHLVANIIFANSNFRLRIFTFADSYLYEYRYSSVAVFMNLNIWEFLFSERLPSRRPVFANFYFHDPFASEFLF